MFNAPDDFTGIPGEMSASDESAHEYNLKHVEECHQVYRDTLNGFAASSIVNGKLPSLRDVQVIAEAVGESLADNAAPYVEALEVMGHSASYLPDDADKLAVRCFESIRDALAIKPIDWSGLSNALYRAHMPTNPTTLTARGDL